MKLSVGLSTTDYLAVVLDAYLLDEGSELAGTPGQLHFAFKTALEDTERPEGLFEGIDFSSPGATELVFSHSLAAAFSNLQSLGAIERVNPKLKTYRRARNRVDGDELASYAEEVKGALASDEIAYLEKLAKEWRRRVSA